MIRLINKYGISAPFFQFLTAIMISVPALFSSVINEKYYAGLSEYRNKPERASFLIRFIYEHPSFEPAFEHLYQYYVRADSLEQALKTFSLLLRRSECRQFAFWCLARLSEIKGEISRANDHYQSAIKIKDPPQRLLDEYVEFDQRHALRFSALDTIRYYASRQKCQFAEAYSHLYYDHYQKANDIYARYMTRVTDIYYLETFALSLVSDRNHEPAIELLRTAEKIAEKSQNKRALSRLYLLFAFAHMREYNFAAAMERVTNAGTLAKEIDDLFLIAQAQYYKGRLHNEMDNDKQARNLLRAASANFKKLYQKRRYADCLYWTSYIYRNQSLYCEANKIFDRCIPVYAEINRPYGLMWATLLQALNFEDLSLIDLAKLYYQNALDLAVEYEYKKQINLITAYLESLDIDSVEPGKAETIILQKINLADERRNERSKLPNIYKLATHYRDCGDIDSARKTVQWGLDLAGKLQSHEFIAWFTLGFGLLYATEGRNEKAISTFHKVREYSIEHNQPRMCAAANHEIGKIYEKMNDLTNAAHYYRAAISHYETFRKDQGLDEFKIGVMSERQAVYERLSECYYELYQTNPSFELLQQIYAQEEMLHARSLKENLENKQYYQTLTNSILQDSTYLDARRNFAHMQQSLRELALRPVENNELDRLFFNIQREKYNLLLSKLAASQNLAGQDSLSCTEPSLSLLQKKLYAADQSIIIYHITDRKSFALAINADSVKVITLPTVLDTLKKDVQELLQPFHHVQEHNVTQVPFYAKTAHSLYKQLFEPIERIFSIKESVLILKSPAVVNVPFDMLLFEPPAKDRYTPTDNNDYMPLFLLNRYAFHYNPTTVTLLQSKQRKKRPKVAVLADAFQETGSEIDKSVQLRLRTGWTFEPLFYSKIEAGQIKRCAARCDTFLRNNASEEMFKKIAKGYDILHIASHAFIDTLFDNFSGLILALPDRTNQDGILMAFEIDEQQLNCELVTLSACETGRGDFVHGEGVLGLPRHFQIAGAQSVIMSHWKVVDQFTAHLMPLFYRLYLKDGLSISKALQQAKLLATSGTRPRPFDYRHPFFWASFSLYGDMGKPAKKTPLLYIGLGLLILLYALCLLILSRYKKKKISVIRP